MSGSRCESCGVPLSQFAASSLCITCHSAGTGPATAAVRHRTLSTATPRHARCRIAGRTSPVLSRGASSPSSAPIDRCRAAASITHRDRARRPITIARPYPARNRTSSTRTGSAPVHASNRQHRPEHTRRVQPNCALTFSSAIREAGFTSTTVFLSRRRPWCQPRCRTLPPWRPLAQDVPGPSGHAVMAGPLGLVSCSSFAAMSARSVTLETFPTWVRGSASTSSRRSGHLYLARPSASR